MSHHVRTTSRFEKQLSKLDRHAGHTILKWLSKHVDGTENPQASGKALVGNYDGHWRLSRHL